MIGVVIPLVYTSMVEHSHSILEHFIQGDANYSSSQPQRQMNSLSTLASLDFSMNHSIEESFTRKRLDTDNPLLVFNNPAFMALFSKFQRSMSDQSQGKGKETSLSSGFQI